MDTYYLKAPLSAEDIVRLKSGDMVYLSGHIYTARDAAHKKLIQCLENGEELPFPIQGETLYYVGPCPPKPGEVIGSAGPTTSGRMDAYTPQLLAAGLKAMIGKGERNKAVIEGITANQCIYFAAIGGAGALIKNAIEKSQLVAFEELGTEAIRKLEIKDMPLIVAIDSQGNNLYQRG